MATRKTTANASNKTRAPKAAANNSNKATKPAETTTEATTEDKAPDTVETTTEDKTTTEATTEDKTTTESATEDKTTTESATEDKTTTESATEGATPETTEEEEKPENFLRTVTVGNKDFDILSFSRVPKRYRPGAVYYPFDKLEPGYSFTVTPDAGEDIRELSKRLSAQATSESKLLGQKFSVFMHKPTDEDIAAGNTEPKSIGVYCVEA